MTHERFRVRNTKGRWAGQNIDYDVSLMVRATGRHLFIAGLTGLDLDGKMVGVGDPAAQADQAMKNLKILLEEAGGDLEEGCGVGVELEVLEGLAVDGHGPQSAISTPTLTTGFRPWTPAP